MRLTIVLALFSLLALAVPTDAADTPEEAAIRDYLKKHPEAVFEALESDPGRVYDLVIQGQAVKRKEQMRAEWRQDLARPLTPEVDKDRAWLGDMDAPVTIVEYSDFQCPYCSRAAFTVKELMKRHPKEIRLTFKHFPLNNHQQAPMAASYFEAAALQDVDKAWLLHDMLFANGDGGQALEKGGEVWVKEQAAKVGLDVDKLAADSRSEKIQARIKADMAEAESFGIRGTPHFLVNGVNVKGAISLDDFEELLDMVREAR